MTDRSMPTCAACVALVAKPGGVVPRRDDGGETIDGGRVDPGGRIVPGGLVDPKPTPHLQVPDA